MQLSEVIMRTRRYLADLAGSTKATDVISQDVSVAQIEDRLKDANAPGVSSFYILHFKWGSETDLSETALKLSKRSLFVFRRTHIIPG